jgi:hypothetical protein
VRLPRLLLTLTILGVISFILAKLWFRPEFAEAYAVILSAVGAISALGSLFLGQTLGRIEKLLDVRLGPIQEEIYRRKLQKRRSRLFLKFGTGMGLGTLALCSGQILKITKEPLIAGLGVAFLIVSFVSVCLIVIEYASLAKLLDDINRKADQQKRKEKFWTPSAR